ncbi:HNH endonuclease [Flaviflexus massiliensis]|uniref:HNH endonuclease n=1 Tax=Flaviflexus massiliensis TaxID=1522309 RepID=UPI00097D65C0
MSPRRTNGRAQQNFSRIVLARANGRCEVQGPNCQGRAVEADHIIPLMDGGSHDPENGRAVCRPCHRTFTDKQIFQAKNAWRRKPIAHPADTAPQGLYTGLD